MDKILLSENLLRRIEFIFLLMIFLWTLFPSSELSAQSLVEKAKQEGKVTFYSGLIVPDTQAITDAFQKKYPFIKADYYRNQMAGLHERLLSEQRAGKNVADVVHTLGIWGNIYKKERLLGNYISPESKTFAQGFKDPEGYWTAFYTAYYTMLYNTRMLAKEELPKTYEDLLDPKWKGKIGIYSGELEWYIGMLSLLGEDKGRQYMKRLANQNLRICGGRTLAANLVVAGEFPLALGLVARGFELQRAGAPVGMITFTPTLTPMRIIGVHADAPHPNAGKLLVDFILSKEGQDLMTRRDRLPIRPGIQAEPELEAIKRNLLPIKPLDLDLLKKYNKEYDSIILKR